MAASWRYLDGAGLEVGVSRNFPDREGAEAWLGEAWAGLLDLGVVEVELVEEGRAAYRMGLEPA